MSIWTSKTSITEIQTLISDVHSACFKLCELSERTLPFHDISLFQQTQENMQAQGRKTINNAHSLSAYAPRNTTRFLQLEIHTFIVLRAQ